MSNKNGKLPPFGIRNAAKIEESLGLNAIIPGFVQIPIATYMDNVWEDDLYYGSCQYAATTDNERFPEDSTYTEELYLRDDLRYQYQKEFGLNDSQT